MTSKGEDITEEERGKSGGPRDQTLPYRLRCIMNFVFLVLQDVSTVFDLQLISYETIIMTKT